MADYQNKPLLSKVKIGEQIYWLKDAELRALVEKFKGAVNYDVDVTFNKESANLATSAAIATYLEDAIAGLTGAMHFVGVKEELPAEGAAGDIVIVGTAEYVHDGSKWIEIGDEGVYATIAGVERDYVQKAALATALEDYTKTEDLGALALKDEATGTVAGETISGVKATGTLSGSIDVELAASDATITSAGQFTPAGSVAGTTVAAGSVSIARDENGFAPSGSVSAPELTITPNTATVQHIDSLGELPTYTAAQYVAPSVTEASSGFATEGMVAALDIDDAEMLVLSSAATSNALTSTGFNAGSYTAAQFTAGALPTLGAEQTVMTGIASATASAPTFTGDKIAATFTGTEAAISATFAGTEGTVNVSGTGKEYAVSKKELTLNDAELAVGDITVAAKSVTVS